MKKSSNILLTIGTVLSFISGAVLLVLGVLFVVLGSSREAIIQGLENGTITTTMEGMTNAEIAANIQVLCLTMGITFLVVMLLNVANGVIAIISKKKGTKGLYILNTIFGAISSMAVTIVGGILGLVNNHKQNRQLAISQQQ